VTNEELQALTKTGVYVFHVEMLITATDNQQLLPEWLGQLFVVSIIY
jgi:hypothetical protein